MRAIDANVLVRLTAQDNAQQAASAAAFIQGGAWVSILALVETTWVLSTVYGLTSKDLARTIETLLDHRDLVLQDPDIVAAALKLFRERPVLGFTDCVILQLARKAGHLPLGTFDRNLAKAHGAQAL